MTKSDVDRGRAISNMTAIALEEELTINIDDKNIKWTIIISKKSNRYIITSLIEYDRWPFRKNFVWLTKGYFEFNYVWSPNPIVRSIRYAGIKGQGTGKKCSLYQGFIILKFVFISYYDWGKENRSLYKRLWYRESLYQCSTV